MAKYLQGFRKGKGLITFQNQANKLAGLLSFSKSINLADWLSISDFP